MMSLDRVRRIARKPPGVIADRLRQEIRATMDRGLAPLRAKFFSDAALLDAVNAPTLDALWERLATPAFVAELPRGARARLAESCPGEEEKIRAAAERALRREIDLLGTGPRTLGAQIPWRRELKTGFEWPHGYFRALSYGDPHRTDDVKIPWELSRLQWYLPVAQLYLLTGEERLAEDARAVLESWLADNPYAGSINWSCTMEVALRIFTWTALFRAFHGSAAWKDREFRSRFLRGLYLHGQFTERYVEESDVNGNHCTADYAALVQAGLFWGDGRAPARWHEKGWAGLCRELPRQVTPDGVDFEASVPYHRLVLELFLLPAIYRQRRGFEVPASYRERVLQMARFTAAYSRPEGSVPLVGDADDARTMPWGTQALNDHRYLMALVGLAFDDDALVADFGGPRGEIFWLLGPEAAARLPVRERATFTPGSTAFREGGIYVLRNERDHVTIDCAPVGLANRGGHGHNDCLSFEAVLDGVPLVTDCGAYLYTASYKERNLFRSTAYHNTPGIDGVELNRFVRWDWLWFFHYDAVPELRRWEPGSVRDVFVGAHAGYRKLTAPVTPVREISLEHTTHRLQIYDRFEGEGEHVVRVPLHLTPGVEVLGQTDGCLLLVAGAARFTLRWSEAADWTLDVGTGRVSPSYGVVQPCVRLEWRREGALKPLTVTLEPGAASST